MEKYFDLQTHKLNYRIIENPGKEKILFLHGLGANLNQFKDEIDSLSEKYSVAAISLRGQGKSTRPQGDNPEDMKISSMATDVIHWIKYFGWEKTHIVACSMGGVVALEILDNESILIKSLVTFGTTPKLYFPRFFIQAGAFISDLLLPKLIPGWMAKNLPKTITDKKEARKRFSEDLLIAYSQRKTIYQIRCELACYDYMETLKKTDVPVLILQGEKDSAINKEVNKLWPEIKENTVIRRETIKDAGHIANYDQPDEFSDKITAFIGGIKNE